MSACATAEDADADFTDVSELSAGSNPYSNTRLVGTIDLGFSRSVLYRHTPRYRALQFHADAGTQLELFVRSTQGDPMMWLVDSNFDVVAFNDDANEETNSNISIDSLVKTDDYYIVFRDKDLESHYFDVAAVQLDLPANAPTVESIEAVYEGHVASGTLAMREVPRGMLPYLAQGLYDRWLGELGVTAGLEVRAYNLRVGGQAVWFVRKYQAGSGMEAAAYVASGPMIGVAGGASELIDSWDH